MNFLGTQWLLVVLERPSRGQAEDLGEEGGRVESGQFSISRAFSPLAWLPVLGRCAALLVTVPG